jgi:hypothetical protein
LQAAHRPSVLWFASSSGKLNFINFKEGGRKMKTSNLLSPGNIVEFTSSKGLVKGVVIATKWSGRGQKAAKQFNVALRAQGRKFLVPEGQMVYEIADTERNMIWTTSVAYPVGKATKKQLIAGKELKARLMLNNAEVKQANTSRNLEKQDEKDIARLNRGADIEIKYIGGIWRKERFSHYTNSGKIAFFSSRAKKGVRYAYPSGVRKAK